MTPPITLAGSEMGDLQTFFWVIIEGVTGLVIVAVLSGIASMQLARMWRSREQRLVLLVAAVSVFTGVAFTVIATFGVTWGAFHYHGP